MLLEANGAPTRGRRRCYHRVVAMLQAVGAGVATGTGATKMPATMLRGRPQCYKRGRRRRDLTEDDRQGRWVQGGTNWRVLIKGLRCHPVRYLFCGRGGFCGTAKKNEGKLCGARVKLSRWGIETPNSQGTLSTALAFFF